MAQRKKKAAKKAAGKTKSASNELTIEIRGESFVIEEADELFAIKRRRGTDRGALKAAQQDPRLFRGLEFQQADSTFDVEVFRIDAASRDAAMKRLRERRIDAEWCAHVYHMAGDPDGRMIPTDSIYIELAPDVDPETLNEVLEEHHVEVMPADVDQPNAYVLRLTSASTKNPIRIAHDLLQRTEITVAEPDFAVKMKMTAYRPTDTLFPQQWHLENRGGFGLTAGADIKAPDAWEITRGDRSIRICVMDDGVQTDHPDFSFPGKIVDPRDFGQNDLDPRPVSSDDNHGTACAGVAVADENGAGVVGSAPKCALMPYRTSGFIDNTRIKTLFDTARLNGADVISCSWGVASPFFTLSTVMFNAIRRAATEGRGGRGCVILFASGNEDSPVDGTKNGQSVRSGFAIHPDVIAVNASNSRDVRSHYSNFGPETWICAPSSGSGGRGIVTTDRTGSVGYQSGDYTTVNGFGGTSSSCPLVAGVCGLMLSVNPELTSTQVREILRDTADKIDPANGNYGSDGHSDDYGYGRVNAYEAVKRAQSLFSPPTVRRVAFERTPGLLIPDARLAGVTDTIQVDESATVQTVEVSIDISHSYRGDLVVELMSPDGTVVRLHDRTGRWEDDLERTYSVADLPSLAGFAGQTARGNWALKVADHAHADVGTLESWSLVLGLEGGPRTEWEVEPGEIIPDDDPEGITSEIQVEESGALADIELTLDITHSYRGDLRVTLEGPGGVSAEVHRRTGRWDDDIRRSYTPEDTPALAALLGGDINGSWSLHVSDHAFRDIGKLNAWKLRLLTGTSGTLQPRRAVVAEQRARSRALSTVSGR